MMIDEIVYDEDGWHDAGLEAYAAFEQLGEATTLVDQAHALVRLTNAMSCLVTWLPGWDWEKGILKDPRYER